MSLRMVDIIIKKREKKELTKQEIDFFVKGFVSGEIPDYQASALLMAICLCSMTPNETANLTLAMTYSGETVDLSKIKGIKVDKHSTGGVGDTTTLIVAPMVAACGASVAKMSGRGLGHTGGTIDKLESIKGFKVERTIEEFIDLVNKHGIAVVGQSGNLVPADKLLYALRDVTGTVESIPLIASSIMSKKLAAGSDAIVLDVKTGKGAFMATKESAQALAKQMCDIGAILNRKTVAIITDMNQPLGNAIGNGLEVQEAIMVLSNKVDLAQPLVQVSLLLASHMLVLAKIATNLKEAETMLIESIVSGSAKEKFKEMIIAMGGETKCIDDCENFVNPKYKQKYSIKQSGYITEIMANQIGLSAQILGAGRAVKTDIIDPDVGLVFHKRVGDYLEEDEAICTFYFGDFEKFEQAKEVFKSAIKISKEKPKQMEPMVLGIVTAN